MPFDNVPSIDIELPHLGDTGAKVLVVLDPMLSAKPSHNPLRREDVDWLGPRLLKYTGLKRTDIQFVSCARSITFEESQSDKTVSTILKEWEDHFTEVVNELKPSIIVPMGARACKQVIGRAVQITKVRGQVLEASKRFGTTPILPLTSPFYARKHPESENIFCADLETLGRVAKGGFKAEASHTTIKTHYKWCYDIKHLLANPPELISLDVESLGLYPFDPETRLLTIQITTEPGKGIIIPIEYDAGDLRHHNQLRFPGGYTKYIYKIVRQLKRLLENPKVKVIGQNLKFDWLMIYYKLGIEIANYYGDTLLMAHLLDENMMSKSLDDLIRVYVPAMSGYADTFNKDPIHQAKTRMDLVPPEQMIAYGCGDTDASLRLYNKLLPKLRRDRKLYACYKKTVMRAIRAFCYVEQTGFYINQTALKDFERSLRITQKKEAEWLLQQIPESIKAIHRDTGVGLKPDRDVLLLDYLYYHPDGLQLEIKARTKTGRASVSSKVALPYYVADYPFVKRLTDYIKNQKMLTTYLAGFYKYIFKGKIRPSYALHKTTTGRSASDSPNGQNFPKRGKMAKIFRRAFEAPKGWVYLQVDLSQAELRIAALISGDERMMQVYLDGGDIHRATAAGVMGITVEEFLKLPKDVQALKRFQAKAVNFGFLYGMWWKKFREYAKTDYNIDFTDEEAAQIREMFFNTYPRLEQWHNAIEKWVRKHKMVRAFNGRIRHLPMVDSSDDGIAKQAIRQGINCLSDDTQILTERGWKHVDELSLGELAYSVNPQTGKHELCPIENIHVGQVDQDMYFYEGKAFSAVATPNHRWLVKHHKNHKYVESANLQMTGHHKIMLSSNGAADETETEWTDDEVRLAGWVLTDGYYKKQPSKCGTFDYSRARVGITQSKEAYLDELYDLANRLKYMTVFQNKRGQHIFNISSPAAEKIRQMMPDKTLTPEYINSLSNAQRVILFETMLKGDGSWCKDTNRFRKFTCDTKQRADMFLMLCASIGQTARANWRDMRHYEPVSDKMTNVPRMNGVWQVELCVNKYAQPQYGHSVKRWKGRVWCPTIKHGSWIAKRDNKVFITGNSPVQSIASDLGLMAIGLLVPYLRRTGLWEHIKVCGFIHDSIVCLVKEEYAAKAMRLVKKTMENLPLKKWFDWEPEVPIIADAEIGRNLADTYEVPPELFSVKSGNKSFSDIERIFLQEDYEKLTAKPKLDEDEHKRLADLAIRLGHVKPKPLPVKVRRRYTKPKPTERKTHAKTVSIKRAKRIARRAA